MKYLIQFISFYLICTSLVSASSYWDTNNPNGCADTNVYKPANASNTLVWFAGEDDNQLEYVYEQFKSELGDGLAVQVFDSTGADVTANMSSVFTYNPATYDADSAVSTYWSVTVNDPNGTLLVAGDVYVWALTALYYYAPTTYHTTTTPFAVMEKVELFDAAPFVVMVDNALEKLDPIITNHFFDIAAVSSIFLFGICPGVMSLGQLIMAAFLPPIYWGMAVFNVPITLALGAYWYVGYTKTKAKLISMGMWPGEEAPAAEEDADADATADASADEAAEE